jgi:pyrroline-5-carboxylate reductase
MDTIDIALIGCGRMGSALADGWLKASHRGGGLSLTVVEPSLDSAMQRRLKRSGARLNPAEFNAVSVLVLAVKPQSFAEIVPLTRGLVGPDTMIVSIMAGVTVRALAAAFATRRVVRAMPNTPGAIGAGITGWVAGEGIGVQDANVVESLLAALGEVVQLDDEAQMDALTAVSGSGPAYVFLLAEALAAAGANEGLPRDLALRLARATVAGSGALMLSKPDEAPSDLRQAVTSPNGTTAAALDVLQGDDGLMPVMRRAVRAATLRSRALGEGAP